MEIHLDATFLPAAATHETHQGSWQERKKLLFVFIFMPVLLQGPDCWDVLIYLSADGVKCHLVPLHWKAILILMT